MSGVFFIKAVPPCFWAVSNAWSVSNFKYTSWKGRVEVLPALQLSSVPGVMPGLGASGPVRPDHIYVFMECRLSDAYIPRHIADFPSCPSGASGFPPAFL